ncbi:MAG TPA: DUF4240 domain-containing protein [Cyclobacteriaceae bacterium]
MTEQIFWQLIEEAWQHVAPDLAKRRHELAYSSTEMKEESELGNDFASVIDEDIVEYLTEKLKEVDQVELQAFDKILEQKLYDIDREDIQQFTDGSDDGFLYCRGFIVGMGKDYYDSIYKDPGFAAAYLEAESFCYFSWHLHEELHGEYTESEISRETGSNAKHWS